MTSRVPLTLLLVLTGAATAAAQSPLDHIPSDALGALVIRDLNELAKKGDKLLDDTNAQQGVRISNLLSLAFIGLGIPQGELDLGRPIALVLADPRSIDPKLKLEQALEGPKCIVAVLPFNKQEDFEKALGLEAGILKGGQVVKLPKKLGQFGDPGLEFIAMKGKHVYLGFDEKAVRVVSKAKGVGGELTAEQRKLLDRSDVLLHLGTEGWGAMWKDAIGNVEKELAQLTEEDEKKVAKGFVEALKAVRFGMASLRLDEGVGVSFMSVMHKEGHESARKFLAELGGEGTASLRGLAEGHVLAAMATGGTASPNNALARVMMRSLLQDLLVPRRVVGAGDRPALLSTFLEMWQRVRGGRAALYKSADTNELGLFSAVGILDTENPEQLLAELRQLARLGSSEGLDVKTEAGKKATEAEINKLIADLSHRRYPVRASAEEKLKLAGEQVLSYLEKAIKESADLEGRRRAERVKGEIVQLAEARRKELLSGDPPWSVKPSFVFTGKTEKVEGYDVQLVGVRLSKEDKTALPKLKGLLGPDWNKVRLAVHGKQVVALVGSDLGLLQKTLRNLKDDKPGLPASKLFAGQAKQTDPKRKIEIHASSRMAINLATAADLEKPSKVPLDAPTSMTVSIEPDRVQLDLWIPLSEIKAITEEGRKQGNAPPLDR
jgi:hypothetical protein